MDCKLGKFPNATKLNPRRFFFTKKTGGGEKIRDVYPYVPMGTHSAVVFLGVGLNGC